MFSVGDKVMHRIHGAGVITEKKEMQVTDRPTCYFVIDVLGSRSTLMVPTDKAERRLRPVSKMATLRRLLTNRLAGQPGKLPKNYKKRAGQIKDKLKSGRVKAWIEVVRDLIHRDEQKPLSRGDRKLLDRAMDLLSGELALAQGIEQEKAETQLASIVERRHELLKDQQVDTGGWLQTLAEKVIRPFAKGKTQATADAK